MQAVILAGGLGTRLRPITKQVPKPMVPVAGRPYLEHQIEALRNRGIRDIVLLTGYLGEQIEDHFGDGRAFGVRISYSREPEPLGTGGALRLAATQLHPDFLLLYGDSFLPIDYADVVNTLRRSGMGGLMVVYNNSLDDTSVKNNVALDGARVVLYEKDSARHDLEHVEAGVLAFRKGIIDLIPAGGTVSLEKVVFPVLIEKGQLIGYVTRQRFFDIGTPSGLSVIEEYMAPKATLAGS